MQSMRQLVEDFNNEVTASLFSPSKFKKELKNLLQLLSDFGIMINVRILTRVEAVHQKSQEESVSMTLIDEGVMPSDGETANRDSMTLLPSNCTCILSYKLREDLRAQHYLLQDFAENILPLLKKGIEQIYGQRIDGRFFVPRIDTTERKNIERAIREATRESPALLASLDIDDFKRFNDCYSEETGDEAIRRVGLCLSEKCQEYERVYFYKSHEKGDEFLILIFGRPLVEAMRILLVMQDSISKLHIDEVDVPFASSCGIAIYPYDAELPVHSLNHKPSVGTYWLGSRESKEPGSFDHYYFLAEQARRMKHGEPKGGSPVPKSGIYRYKYFAQRLASKYEPTIEDLLMPHDEAPFLVASCKQFSFFQARSNPDDSDADFEYIVHKLAQVQKEEDLWSCFQKSLAQLNITISPVVPGDYWIKSLADGKISWPTACALFVASFNRAFFYDSEFRKRFQEACINIVLRCYSEEEKRFIVSLEVGNPSKGFIEMPINLAQNLKKLEVKTRISLALYVPESLTGKNIPKYNIAPQDLPQSGAISIRSILSPVFLLMIGKELEIPASLEAVPSAICYLDDRPTIGGGLPDPWQSNISKIVNYTTSNPNVRFLVFYGNKENSAQTWKLCSSLDAEVLLSKCESFVERRLLERFTKQVKKVENCSSYNELRNVLPLFLAPEMQEQIKIKEPFQSELYIDDGCIREKPIKPEADPEKERIYEREMPLQNYQLGSTEGLVFEDINWAYPAVIDMLRKLSPDSLCEDQIGRQMRELRGFKLVLTKPVPPGVPLFFRRTKSESEFEDYYKKVFNKDEGIFGKRIHKYPLATGETFDQYNRQLDYVCEQIKKGVATRRAGIQIAAPFVDWVDVGKEVPLGLVDIAILPRPKRGKRQWQLHYFFNWRTVEAIVGFPFSAYTSCRFAGEFTKDAQERLGKECSVDTGEVVYYAISLHMFEDQFERRVARRIVEQVTK